MKKCTLTSFSTCLGFISVHFSEQWRVLYATKIFPVGQHFMNKDLICYVLWFIYDSTSSVSFLDCLEFLPLIQPRLTENQEHSFYEVVLKSVTVFVGLHRLADHTSYLLAIKLILIFWSRKEKEARTKQEIV